jgi:hypothetical protein
LILPNTHSMWPAQFGRVVAAGGSHLAHDVAPSTSQPCVARKGLARHLAEAEAALKTKLEELKAAFAEKERLTQRYNLWPGDVLGCCWLSCCHVAAFPQAVDSCVLLYRPTACTPMHGGASRAKVFSLAETVTACGGGLGCVRAHRLHFVQTVLPAVERQINVLGRGASRGLQPPSGDGVQQPAPSDDAASSLGVSDVLCAVMAESSMDMGEEPALSSSSGTAMSRQLQQQHPIGNGRLQQSPAVDAAAKEQIRALVIQQYTDLVCSLSRSLMTIMTHPGQTGELYSIQSQMQAFKARFGTASMHLHAGEGRQLHGACQTPTRR